MRFELRSLGRGYLKVALSAAIGCALVALMIVHVGPKEIITAFNVAGWRVFPFAAFHFIPLFTDTLGWRSLLDPARRPRLVALYIMRWTGESVNNVLPLGTVGGDILRASLAARAGLGAAEAGAGVVVDVTLGFTGDVILAVIGFSVIVYEGIHAAPVERVAPIIAAMIALFTALIVAQKKGLLGIVLQRVARLPGVGRWAAFLGGIGALDQSIQQLYAHVGTLLRCLAFRFTSAILGGIELYIGLILLGRRVRMVDAVIIHCLTTVIRGAAFFLPAGLGVQEWSIVALTGAMGVSPEVGAALALMRRVRDAIFGAPGLLAFFLVRRRGPLFTGDSRAPRRPASPHPSGSQTSPTGT
jgi:putative membrane protein